VPSTPAQLGVAIAGLREKRGLSIETLAAAAGIHFTYLSKIENGRGNPSWKVVGNLAKELGVEIAELDQLARA
jgi:transcriptional regulator with XRE-family HTH domain